MPTTTGFRDVDNAVALDIATKFVTKEYLLDFYPDLVPAALTPRLLLWGSNGSGQLGTNNTTTYSSPVETVSRGTNWKQTDGGKHNGAAHFGGIKTDGTLWMWGFNQDGRVGDNTSVTKSSPVTTIVGGATWKQLSCGYSHSMAIKTDGTLWAWGSNSAGQNCTNVSITISTLSPQITVGSTSIWKQVACGSLHVAIIKTDGTLWTCGRSNYFQLGDGTSTQKSSPVTTMGGGTNWKQVACGREHVAAVKTDGTLWTWGRGFEGQHGDNNTSSAKSSPTTTIAGGTNWKQVACGDLHTAAIKTDGTLWTWGRGTEGQLGDGTSSYRSSPVTTAGGGTNWKQVSGGGSHTMSIKTDGTLWVWGRNNNGQLGDNTSANRSSPVTTVAGGTNWKQVACGYSSSGAIAESEGW